MSSSRRVIVVPHDPLWKDAFQCESKAIVAALGENLLAIHHVGSTSIPGIFAKPVIDMLVVVKEIEQLDQQSREMETLGYEVMGEFGIPGRRYFRKNDLAGMRTHQIHAFEVGSPDVERHLAFRDYLRAHLAIALQYSDLKRRLADLHPDDIEAYMDGKDPFIKEVESNGLKKQTKGGMTGSEHTPKIGDGLK